MRAMMVSDYLSIRGTILQLVGMAVVVGICVGFAMQRVVVVASALSVMLPFLFLFSLAATDEANDWQRFRLTLPITRHQVVFGRYGTLLIISVLSALLSLVISGIVMALAWGLSANFTFDEGLMPTSETIKDMGLILLICLCISLISIAVSAPLIMRFGLNKATRLGPVIVVLGLSFGLVLFGDSGIGEHIAEGVGWALSLGGVAPVLVVVVLLAIVLLLYGISALIAAKLYETRVL